MPPAKTEISKSDPAKTDSISSESSKDKPLNDKPLVKRTTTDLKPVSADPKSEPKLIASEKPPTYDSKPEPKKLITTDKPSETKPTVKNQRFATSTASDRTPVVPMPAYQGPIPAYQGRTDSYSDDREEELLDTKIEIPVEGTASVPIKNGSNGKNGSANSDSTNPPPAMVDHDQAEVHAVTGETQAFDAFSDDEQLLRPDDDTDETND